MDLGKILKFLHKNLRNLLNEFSQLKKLIKETKKAIK